MAEPIRLDAANSLALIQREENDFFDKKSKDIDGQKIEKIAIGFSNADGGEFVVGIEDEKRIKDPKDRWVGFKYIEDANFVLQSLFHLSPSIDFKYEFLTSELGGGFVLRVNVEKSSEVAKTSNNKVYQRAGAQCILLSDPAQITALAFAKGARSYENFFLESPPEEIVDSKEIARFCGELSPVQDPLSYCVNEGLVDRKTFAPCCAAAILFTDNPEAIVPKKCSVRVVFYDTKLIKPEREHLKKNIAIHGSAYTLVHEVTRAVTEIMSSISIFTDAGLKKVEYPPETLWEVIVNAVIHRDYSISDDVQIFIYQNRIEVLSPGKLPGFVTVDNYLDVRYSRNPKIVRTLSRYRNPPNKDLGEGLNTAFQKMKEWRLKDPILSEEGNYVKVTISHTPLATPEELVLEFIESNKTINNKAARSITGIHSENQMKDVFYRLRDRGLIERVPELKGNAAAWRKVEKAGRDIE